MKIITTFADVIKRFVAMEQMKTNIIQVGSGQGVVLPSDLLSRLRLGTKSSVNVSVEDNRIAMQPSPRKGWAEAAKQMVEAGDDELLIPDFFEDEDLSWWTWEEEKK
ncbi:MAG: AbrB/MazE/SpoVT family DNA-binding domain-containing protein [Prevotellaceae bacterium]|jgi:antitoxin MazE|nr:AbrB/MazE/SpoVT family DNA-binding domain-containing protein [Prevotellaceae bacterium]